VTGASHAAEAGWRRLDTAGGETAGKKAWHGSP
jgi:hypothetical protein